MGRKGEEEEDYNMYVRMYINLHLKCINLISSTISSTYSHNEREIEPPTQGVVHTYTHMHIRTYIQYDKAHRFIHQTVGHNEAVIDLPGQLAAGSHVSTGPVLFNLRL